MVSLYAIVDELRKLNDFDVYRGNSTTSLHNSYRYKYAAPFEKVDGHIEKTLFLQSIWYHSITISFVYFIIIKCIERWMRDRPAFNLKRPLFIWNASLALFSAIGFIRFTEDVVHSLTSYGLHMSFCYTIHPKDVAAFWSLMFAISKVVELGDTLFVVLRKKPLIFLHYYHHAVTLIYTAQSGAEHAASGRFFVSMNLFVHSLMYTYYAFSVYGIRPSRKVSKALTIIQTIQMFLGILVTALAYKMKMLHGSNCQQSIGNLYLALIIYITFAILFVQFYLKKYMDFSKKSKKD